MFEMDSKESGSGSGSDRRKFQRKKAERGQAPNGEMFGPVLPYRYCGWLQMAKCSVLFLSFLETCAVFE